MSLIPKDHVLHRWFAGLVEASFQTEIGIAEPSVLDYLTDLLTEFVHVERINLLSDGRSVEEVAAALSAVQIGGPASDEVRRRDFHRHIGDFTLFWTGVYPENLRRMHRRGAKDDLIDFFDQGKRSYAIASHLSTGNSEPPADVLKQLSDQFEYCVYGLGLVRKQWESSGNGPGGLVVG
ncbi:MAG TPA: hypothetical protein VNT79_01915 [Phycisphaerae bacterium]|nr:hypothetical protein [Phycisphaerae bacterium]